LTEPFKLPWEAEPEPFKLPWEVEPAHVQLPTVPLEKTVALIQKDMAYCVTHTSVMVHSSRPELEICVNTARGQLIPRGECRFTDGTTIEFQDIGMPQPGAIAMSVPDLVKMVTEVAVRNLGLEFEK